MSLASGCHGTASLEIPSTSQAEQKPQEKRERLTCLSIHTGEGGRHALYRGVCDKLCGFTPFKQLPPLYLPSASGIIIFYLRSVYHCFGGKPLHITVEVSRKHCCYNHSAFSYPCTVGSGCLDSLHGLNQLPCLLLLLSPGVSCLQKTQTHNSIWSTEAPCP